MKTRFMVGAAVAMLLLGGTGTAAAQTVDQAAASQVFYNIKGGQSVGVAAASERGQRSEAIRLVDLNQRMISLATDTWGIQPLVGPAGLVRVKDGPLMNRNIRSMSNTSLANVDSLLVDPATGLVHYLIGTGAAVGYGSYVLVPITAMDIGNMQTPMNPRDMGMQLKPYSDSKLNGMYPTQVVAAPIQAVQLALVPKEVVAALAKPKGPMVDAGTSMLAAQGLLVGQPVTGQGGAAVGTVTHMVVDRQSNDVRQLVIAVPFFGANQHVMVPMSDIKFDASGKVEIAKSAADLAGMQRYTAAEVVAMFGG